MHFNTQLKIAILHLLVYGSAVCLVIPTAQAQPQMTEEPIFWGIWRKFDLPGAYKLNMERGEQLRTAAMAAIRAIAICNKTEFNRLKEQIEGIIASAKHLVGELKTMEEQRRADIKHQKALQDKLRGELRSILNKRPKEAVNKIGGAAWAKYQKDPRNSLPGQVRSIFEGDPKKSLERMGQAARNAIPEGHPLFLLDALRAVQAAVGQIEKDDIRRSQDFELKVSNYIGEITQSTMQLHLLTQPGLAAAITGQRLREDILIRYATRLLKAMVWEFDLNKCKKCVSQRVGAQKYPKWVARLIARHDNFGACGSETSVGRKMTIQYGDGTDKTYIINRWRQDVEQIK